MTDDVIKELEQRNEGVIEQFGAEAENNQFLTDVVAEGNGLCRVRGQPIPRRGQKIELRWSH
jgi:hypothetical protein